VKNENERNEMKSKVFLLDHDREKAIENESEVNGEPPDKERIHF
jgi:hypothetical protein